MTLNELLLQLGINVTSSFIYDVLRRSLQNEPQPTVEKLNAEIKRQLEILGVNCDAHKIIEFLAKNGDIIISSSSIFANNEIIFESSLRANFEIKNQTCSKTNQTKIEVGTNAFIKGQGGASVHQSKNKITFST